MESGKYVECCNWSELNVWMLYLISRVERWGLKLPAILVLVIFYVYNIYTYEGYVFKPLDYSLIDKNLVKPNQSNLIQKQY